MNKRTIMLLSIVSQGKARELMEMFKEQGISLSFQSVGVGTASSEMMDILGLGTNRKDIIFSLGAEKVVKDFLFRMGGNFSNNGEYGGISVVLKMTAVNRIVSEVLHHELPEKTGKGVPKMKNEYKHNLIMINVGRSYTDQVVQVARRAGATGGTVIRGRLVEDGDLQEYLQIEMEQERDIIFILAPAAAGAQIMSDINNEFGIKTLANAIISALPVEKALKI
ncbi:MAG: hypothetical protein ACOX75_02350 [Lachnospiraceae bacterium]|jgi:hypothetical protein